MHRQPVVSTLIQSAGFDQETGTLELEFQSGSVYVYHDVPRHVYAALLEADSKGTYFNEQIKDQFRYDRIS